MSYSTSDSLASFTSTTAAAASVNFSDAANSSPSSSSSSNFRSSFYPPSTYSAFCPASICGSSGNLVHSPFSHSFPHSSFSSSFENEGVRSTLPVANPKSAGILNISADETGVTINGKKYVVVKNDENGEEQVLESDIALKGRIREINLLFAEIVIASANEIGVSQDIVNYKWSVDYKDENPFVKMQQVVMQKINDSRPEAVLFSNTAKKNVYLLNRLKVSFGQISTISSAFWRIILLQKTPSLDKLLNETDVSPDVSSAASGKKRVLRLLREKPRSLERDHAEDLDEEREARVNSMETALSSSSSSSSSQKGNNSNLQELDPIDPTDLQFHF